MVMQSAGSYGMASVRTLIDSSAPLLPHLCILGLRTVYAFCRKRLTPIDMRVYKSLSEEEAYSKKNQADCNN